MVGTNVGPVGFSVGVAVLGFAVVGLLVGIAVEGLGVGLEGIEVVGVKVGTADGTSKAVLAREMPSMVYQLQLVTC